MAQIVKNLPVNIGDTGAVLGLGRFPGEGNGNPLQCSYLENSVDRGTWWAIVRGSQRVRMTEHTHTHNGCERGNGKQFSIWRSKACHSGKPGPLLTGTQNTQALPTYGSQEASAAPFHHPGNVATNRNP